ncbi:MAG TPA: AarF/UbiB family protein [Rubricoccaceae bacterium]|nr:AarF/UbiB family protein [Rubricoccaceae bacterium]
MALSLKPAHLKRYKDLARLLLKYGDRSLVDRAGLDAALADEIADEELPTKGDPEQLAKDLEALGPTYIKLGQLLSTRTDLLPKPYLDALTKLQDDVDPFPFSEVEAIIEEELGVRLSKAFASFDAEPLAAASLGQVHRATLRDGRPVVVKVQRPDIRPRIVEDLEALGEVATFIDAHTDTGRKFAFADLLDQFRQTLLRELDYRREARNLQTLHDNLARYQEIVIPLPVDDYTSSRVLTMEYVRGTKVTKLSPLARLEIDGAALAEALSRAYLDQILIDGFFHADPHPGNVFITEDRRLALIDLGMVARVDPPMQESLLRLLLALAEGQGDEAATVGITLSTPLEDFDEGNYREAVRALVKEHRDASVEEVEVGRVVVELSRLAAENALRPPPELALLGKTLLNLDAITRALDPTIRPNDVVRRYASEITQRRMMRNLSPGRLFTTALEMNELVQTLPGRVNALLDALTKQEFMLRIQGIDELRLLANLHRIANRVSVSIVLAALIVGAALLMRVQTRFTVFGYPGLAMLLFLLAAGCGFYLVFSILLGEDKEPHARSPRGRGTR